MATIKETKRKGGAAYQIAFMFEGRRRWLSLGSAYTKQDAREIARNVDVIADAITAGRALDRRVEAWLAAIPDDLRDRLARVDLIEARRAATLAELVDAYFDAEAGQFKQKTITSKRGTLRRLLVYFGDDSPADAIDKRSASAFAASLQNLPISDATRAAIIKDCRRLFNWAVGLSVIADNPFNGVKRGAFTNKSREYYIPLDDYYRLLDACPSATWRALIALYRIGGLRRTEALILNWADVDFPGGRLLVHSPKTARHGKTSRVVPLFPELRAELERLWNETPEGGPPTVITGISPSLAWLQLEKIVFAAGLNRWERLIQNFRSSRSIELSRDFGTLAESVWLGHSPRVAYDHYLHLLDEDYIRAAETTTKTTTIKPDFPAKKPRFLPENSRF